MDDAGNILGEARSDTTRFKLDYFPGRYKLSIEANSFYTEVMVQIRTNQITPVAVGLKEREFKYKVYQGIEKLMKR